MTGLVGVRLEPPWSGADAVDTIEERLLLQARFRPISVGTFGFNADWCIPSRSFAHCVLYVHRRGRAAFTIAGARHDLAAGAVVFIGPEVEHSAQSDETAPIGLEAVHFDARLPAGIELTRLLSMPYEIMVPNSARGEIAGCIARLRFELLRPERASPVIMAAECARLFGALWRLSWLHSRSSIPSITAFTRVSPALELIERDFGEPLLLRQLAACAGLSSSRFSDLFRSATGMSPMRYLARYRLDCARRLVETTPLTAGEIAAMSGVRDPAYFSRAFKRRFGLSVTDLRRAGTSSI